MKFKLFQILLLATFICTLNSCTPDDTANGNVENTTTNYSSKKTTNYTYTSYELETLNSINDYRISVGLKPLEKANLLSVESQEHDEYMITNNLVSHEGFATRSETIMKALGAIKVGENIALSNKSATCKAILNAWLASPDHKKNIEGDFTHFGIAIKEDPTTGKNYYTNMFAKI
jgi:uncharacterized protein YkwD